MLEKNQRQAFSHCSAPPRVLPCHENNAEPRAPRWHLFLHQTAGSCYISPLSLPFTKSDARKTQCTKNSMHNTTAELGGATHTCPLDEGLVAWFGLFGIRIYNLQTASTGHGLGLVEVTPAGTQKSVRRTSTTEVASGRSCYRVVQSRCCSSLARPHQHVPVFFPCFLPAECAVRPGLLFGAATPEDKTGLRAVLGRGLPGQPRAIFPMFPQGKGLSWLERGSLGVVLSLSHTE